MPRRDAERTARIPSGARRRVKTPTVLQMEAVECGAAALTIVLWHYGRYESLETMRGECGVSRDGSKAGNIARAARRFGLEAQGYKRETASLAGMRLPLIVYWNFNHFVVLEGFGDDVVYLNDPASGPRTVTWREFDESFTGIVIELAPGPEFVKAGRKPSLWRSIADRLPGSRVAVAYAVLAGLALVVPGLLVPTFTRVFVDDILVAGSRDWVRPLCVGLLLTAAVRGALTWLQQKYLLRLETKLALTTSSRFLWHILRLPMQFFSQRFGGEIGSRVAMNDRVARLLSGQLATNVINVLLIVFYALLMIRYDLLLTAIAVVIALLNMAALAYVARKRIDQNQRLLQDRGKMLGTSMAGLQSIETLKASGIESDFFARWSGHQANVNNAQQAMGVSTQLLLSVPTLLNALGTAAILGVGGLRVMNGAMSLGMLVAFQSLMASFLEPVNQMVGLGAVLQEADGDLKRLDDVLRSAIDPQTAPETSPSPHAGKLAGSLELRNVTFGYSRLDPPLLENFNLSMKPGSRVALVGASGSGKSTISRLISGLHEPWSGEILLDGVPRRELPRSVVSSSVALVDQEIFLFEGTVRDNLTLWDRTVPEADLVAAAMDAFIHDDVAARPRGYDSVIDEGGQNFSGGQRQRLEIGRALVGRPSIVVLDEATSSLDPLTEQRIDDRLRRRGCTCVIIAHRLSTIRDCDEIVVLERGTVVQRGTHDELRGLDGPYARMLETLG